MRPLFALAAVCLALAAWLALPQRASTWRLCIVDTSASVVRRRPGHARWLAERLELEARAAQAAGQELCVIAFDDDLRLVYGPGPARGFDARDVERLTGGPPGESSLLAEALALARGLASDAGVGGGVGGGTVWLCTDGAWTGADPARELAAQAALGLATELVAPPPAELPDARLAGLELARVVERGAPLAAHVRYALEPAQGAVGGPVPVPVDVRLDVVLESAAGRRAWSESRALAPGAGAFVLELGPTPAGIVRVTVEVALAGDPVPENDRATGSTRAGDELACLAVASPESRAEPWLAPGLPAVELVQAAPSELAALLPAADVVLALDLAPALLEAQGVEDFVRRGGGLLVCGGLELLAGWRPERERAPDAWLPLEPDPESLRERDVLLLVDGSGSMQGAPFEAARAGALELVRHAHASDRVWLAFFTGSLEPAHLLLDPAVGSGRGADAAELFSTRSPAGPTDVAGALEALALERAAAGREALVLLLSDGRDQPQSARARLALARTRLDAAGARLVVFATGDAADTELLAALLAPGEELRRVPGEQALEQLMRRELEHERLEHDPRVLAAGPEGAGELAVLLASLQTIPDPTAVWRARVAGAGTVTAWRTERGAPVLALRRHGLGLVAAWAAEPRWSDADLAAVGPLLRALGRPGHAELGMTLVLEERVLTVEGVPPGWPALVRAAPVGGGGGAVLLAPPAAGPAELRVGTLGAERPAPAYELTGLGGEPLARLALGALQAEEFRQDRAIVLPEAGAAARRGGRPHAASALVLAVGFVLLLGAAAAALWPRRATDPGARGVPTASAPGGPGR